MRFAAGDEQARQLLADGQAQLRELLQAQGLNLSGVSVDAGGAGARSGATARARMPSAARPGCPGFRSMLPSCPWVRPAPAMARGRCSPGWTFRVNDQSRFTEAVSRTWCETRNEAGFRALFGQWSAGRAANNSGVDLPCRGNGCGVDAVPTLEEYPPCQPIPMPPLSHLLLPKARS